MRVGMLDGSLKELLAYADIGPYQVNFVLASQSVCQVVFQHGSNYSVSALPFFGKEALTAE